MNEYTNYGRIDITSMKLCATQWAFALHLHMNWKSIRAVPPKLEEPAGHYQSCELQGWKGSQTLQGCNKVATCKYGRYFMLAHRIAKRPHITFPSAQEKK